MEHYNLIKKALEARKFSIAPYSNFTVGAAVETDDGEIFQGCNIESSSFGLTICAERVALFKALSEGRKNIKAIAIASPKAFFCPPCGACRQVLWDFAKEASIILVTSKEEVKVLSLSDLLPNAFDKGLLSDE